MAINIVILKDIVYVMPIDMEVTVQVSSYIQPQNFAYIHLLNKPYENEVTLRRKNPPLKCC